VAAHLDSEIMIMDEVLAVGDMAFQKKCLDKMRDAAQKDGRTVLYVSHNMNTIRQLCDRCVVLDKGRVIYEGDVETAIGHYTNATKSQETKMQLAQAHRENWFQDPHIRILTAEYVNKDNISFDRKEKIRLRLTWENLKQIRDAGLRVELWTLEKTSVATYILYDFYSGEKGDREELEIELDISTLAEASYRMIYTFFYRSSGGINQDIEGVEGLCFDVENLVSSRKLIWRTRAWGHIHMPTPEIKFFKKEM
jgi:lipopolysaccharide transport system ATP-binding protein